MEREEHGYGKQNRTLHGTSCSCFARILEHSASHGVQRGYSAGVADSHLASPTSYSVLSEASLPKRTASGHAAHQRQRLLSDLCYSRTDASWTDNRRTEARSTGRARGSVYYQAYPGRGVQAASWRCRPARYWSLLQIEEARDPDHSLGHRARYSGLRLFHAASRLHDVRRTSAGDFVEGGAGWVMCDPLWRRDRWGSGKEVVIPPFLIERYRAGVI